MVDFKEYIHKLRAKQLRPTKQRLVIAKALFEPKETFHLSSPDRLRRYIEVIFPFKRIIDFQKEFFISLLFIIFDRYMKRIK